MRYAFAALIALIVAGTLYLMWLRIEPGKEISCSSLEPRPVLVAFGDSLIAGYGATEGNDAISRLESYIGVPIKNLGRNGDTSESALSRVDDVLSLKPDVVIVLLGGNDALRGVPVTETEAALSQILTRIKDADAEPVLVGVLGGFPRDPYAAMFERLSEQHGVPLVKNILSGIIGRSEYMSDAIHPNDAGYARIAERLKPFVEKACTATS